MDSDSAVAWADGYSFASYSDWRLPTSDDCLGYDCIGSEMAELLYVELGNTAGGPMTNTGDFQNLQADFYWSGTEYAPDPAVARGFHTGVGGQNANTKTNAFHALAVRPGDVPAVPKPQSLALLLLGLTGLTVAIRRRPH